MSNIFNSSIKYARMAVIILAVSLFSTVFVSCGDDDDDEGFTTEVSLFYESLGSYNVNLSKITGDYICFSIPVKSDGKDIDLSKKGDWSVMGMVNKEVIEGYGNEPDNMFDSGSTLYIHKTGEKTYEIRYTLKKTINGKQKVIKGSYSGSMITASQK